MPASKRAKSKKKKSFSPAEANAMLPLLRSILRDITTLAHELHDRQERLQSAKSDTAVLGTAATIGTGTTFQGNILAGSAVTFTGANSRLVGRALAQTAVTMTGTTISGC